MTRTLLTLASLCLALLHVSRVQAQDAQEVAARVQAFYDRTETLEAEFEQSYQSRLYPQAQRASGRLVFDKPGRMRFDYANGKVMVSDGRIFTAYEPDEDGGAGQYVKGQVTENGLSSAFAFLTGRARIREDYRVRLLDASQHRWRGHVLELRPRIADPKVARIVLFVDARPGTEGVVHRLRFIDHDGGQNTFMLRGMRFNRELADSQFRYTPPRGARRSRAPTG